MLSPGKCWTLVAKHLNKLPAVPVFLESEEVAELREPDLQNCNLEFKQNTYYNPNCLWY